MPGSPVDRITSRRVLTELNMAKVFNQRGNIARQDTTESVANGKHVNHRCLWAPRTKGATAIATSGSERELSPKAATENGMDTLVGMTRR